MARIAETIPKYMSYLGEALSYNKWSLIIDRLIGGVLSVDWPLLDIKASKAKIKCRRKKFDPSIYRVDHLGRKGFEEPKQRIPAK